MRLLIDVFRTQRVVADVIHTTNMDLMKLKILYERIL